MRSIVLLVAFALVVTACGGETASTTTEALTPTTPVETTTTTAESTTTTESVTTTTVAETTTTTETPDPYTFEIVIEGTTVTGGGRLSVPVGETVTLRITSNVADEVHIHGYDLFIDLEPGVASEVSFSADIPGTVEIETHNDQLEIASLEAS
jgi:heme/copper-type cytochrome/quinol oxidase subunit 2